MGYSATSFTSTKIAKTMVQANHNLPVGAVVRFDSGTLLFTEAQADTESNSQIAGMVSSVIDVNTFELTQVGFVFDLPFAVTPGVSYYLSTTTPGELQTTKPSTPGETILLCFDAYTSTSGFFYMGQPILIEGDILSSFTTVTMNTQMVSNMGYVINGVAELEMTLPAASLVGDIIRIVTLGTNGCVIKQNAGNFVRLVDEVSATGVGGQVQLQTTNGVLAGTMTLICMSTDAGWTGQGSGIWLPS